MAGKCSLDELVSAVYQGNIETLRTLLGTPGMGNAIQNNINLHLNDMTPLMYAAMNGQTQAVELLLLARADPHIRSIPMASNLQGGETAKDKADKWGHNDIVKILEKAMLEMQPQTHMVHYTHDNLQIKEQDVGCQDVSNEASAMVSMQLGSEPAVLQAAEKETGSLGLPPTSIALMFPGQGSQYVSMLEGMQHDPKVRELVLAAHRVLGYDLLEICLNGPEEKLSDTSFCQPAMFLGGIAGLEKLKASRPEAVERPGAVAGLSLGEYTALCAAGVFTFEQGLHLVNVRARAMADAANTVPQAMISVAGLEKHQLMKICQDLSVNGEFCTVANELFPKGFACAGTKKAIESLQGAATSAGAAQARLLKTSGAFHTDFMLPAQQKLEVALNELLPTMKPPTCDVYMNVTAQKISRGTPPAEIVPLLARQLVSPVLWEPCMRRMIKDGMSEFFEVGPQKQLKAMMKRIDLTMWKTTTNVDV